MKLDPNVADESRLCYRCDNEAWDPILPFLADRRLSQSPIRRLSVEDCDDRRDLPLIEAGWIESHRTAIEIVNTRTMNAPTEPVLVPQFEGQASVRALFLSDLHLGTKGCQAEKLLEFLRIYDADLIYLVGDIVDGWQLKSGWYWPQAHNDVVQKLLRKARKGARIIYIPGNHDEFLRNFYGTHFGGIEVVENTVHDTADGRRFLVIHGDLFDVVIRHARWLALLGDKAYDLAISLNTSFNAIRRILGLPYWSLSQWLKLKVKNAVNFIGEFEHTLSTEALRHGVNGVICGHIHHAVIRQRSGLTYVNCGDWVESCTAVVEHFDGHLEIIDWANRPSPPVTTDRSSEPDLTQTRLRSDRDAAPSVIPMSPNHHNHLKLEA